MNPIEEICTPLAEKMWLIHRDAETGPRLIFPAKRTDVVRVSEQESKILLCQVLEGSPYFYSIETPTRETYMQSGAFALSARSDVTVYGSRSASDRILNVELKAGTASLEAFRKDFEKLAREGVDGLWFHTLERGDRRTVITVFKWMSEAMRLVSEHTAVAQHTITIAVCVLSEQVLLTTELEFGTGFEAQWEALFADGSARWSVRGPGASAYGVAAVPSPSVASPRTRATVVTAPGERSRTQALIYCPAITDDSVLHFSRLGESYRLRAFTGRLAGRGAWIQPGAPTATEFLTSYSPRIARTLGRGYPRVEDVAAWSMIIAEQNRLAGIPPHDESATS